jgi:AcrR family transcriptional regulator
MREPRVLGRPRQFDVGERLAKIMDVFWVRGYEGTSLSDLMAATGLKKGSLYAAYGDKRAMYQKALELYDETFLEDAVSALGGAGDPVERIDRFLRAAVDPEGRDGRRGCFLCNASTDQAALDTGAGAVISRSLARLTKAVGDVVEQADEGSFGVHRRDGQAGQVIATYFGLRVLIRAGQPSGFLGGAVDEAMRSIFPPR